MIELHVLQYEIKTVNSLELLYDINWAFDN